MQDLAGKLGMIMVIMWIDSTVVKLRKKFLSFAVQEIVCHDQPPISTDAEHECLHAPGLHYLRSRDVSPGFRYLFLEWFP